MNTDFSPIDHPGAWRASESSKDSFTVELTARHLEALDHALQTAKQKTTNAESITRDDFRLDGIEDDVNDWRNQVMMQSGIVILSGFPVENSNCAIGLPSFFRAVLWGFWNQMIPDFRISD